MTDTDASGSSDVDVTVEVNPLVHLIAPLAAIGATMLARKFLNSGYRRVTGSAAPDPGDANVKFARAVMWAAVTAATAAVVEVAVYRIVNQAGQKKA
ncbi:MAG: DUF4235 domain-containing protein [Actinomycetota bacterium]|nr:DUF4235 domain-containing protein [Actinomycetota bacterium]